MFTKTEKGYLVLTLAFLAAGSGIKAYRHAAVKLGPFQNTRHDNPQDIRDTRVIPQSPGIQGDASVPEASAAEPDTPGESSSALGAAPIPPGGGGSQIDDPGGRDTVNDSSILTAMPSISDPAPDSGPDRASDRAPDRAPDRTPEKAHDKTPGNAPPRAPKTTFKTTFKTTSKSAFTAKVDLNRAGASELTRVPGIGAKTAQAIVEYRRAHGPYRDFRDLLRIKGIGEKKLEKLMPNLIL